MKKLTKNLLSGALFVTILFSSLFFTSTVLAAKDYYTNISGSKIHVPVRTQVAPSNASAQCRDSSYSYSQHRRGTCSGHGGVRTWLKNI